MKHKIKIPMKQLLLVFYKVLQEIKLSFKSSRSLITIKQRAGDRYMHVFVLTFALSLFGVLIYLITLECNGIP